MEKKMEAKRIYIPAYIRMPKAIDPETREFDFVISSETKDSHGTVFKADGWRFERYRKNPVVFYQHRSWSDDPDNLIGYSLRLWQEDTLTLGRVRIEDADINPKAERIRKKIINGTLRMASIGADIHKYRFGDKDKGEDPNTLIFEDQELLEWSIVTLASNPDALKRSQQTLTQIRSEFQKEKPEIPPGTNKLSRYAAQITINKNQ
ncbi:MAG: hypothetical protein AAF934_00115 [Bacteroidota bacterium]